MTNPTPQDREIWREAFGSVCAMLCGNCHHCNKGLQAITTARLSGYRQAIEDAAKVAEGKPMRFAGLTEPVIRKAMAAAIRAIGEA